MLQTSKAKTLSNERKGNEVNPDENGLKRNKTQIRIMKLLTYTKYVCMCVCLCVREKRKRKQEIIFWYCDEAKQVKKEERGEACE